MDTHIAELSKTIDPAVLGRRIRNARVAAGLTQSEVAGEDASTAYISRIEAGQRRPDVRLLAKVAARMNTTAEELLLGVTRDQRAELQLALDYAELALSSGDAADALTRVEQVLADAEDTELTDLVRSARYLRAQALETSGADDEAILALEDLAAGEQRDLTWLRVLIALSRCYRESGDLGQAIEVGERGLETLDSYGLAGVDEAVQLTVTVAAAHFERGDVHHASRLCARALTEADKFSSPPARAAAYWNASVIASRQGEVAAALPLAAKALRQYEAGEDGRNVGRLRTQLGILQLRLDPPDPDQAKQTLAQALRELEWSSASPADRAENQLALARAEFLLGDDDAAILRLETLHDLGDRTPLLTADTHVLAGQVAARRGDLTQAHASYQEAILTLSGIGADRGAAQLWFELGGLLEEVGQTDEARDAYRRAAASTGLRTVRAVTQRTTAPAHS